MVVRRFWPVAVAVLLALIALPQLWYPFGFDQMVYAACGDVIRRGGVPIRDCFETKQMGVMVMYALPLLASRSSLPVHALALVWQAGTALAVAKVARDVLGSRAAAFAAGALYWLMYAGINYWSMDQAETFSNVLFVAAFWLLWRAAARAAIRPARLALLAGALLGISLWFKYVFGVAGAALGLGFLLQSAGPARTWRSVLSPAAACVAGVLAVLVAVVGWYGLHPGGLEALFDQLTFLRDNFPLAPPRPFADVVVQMARFLDNGADASGGFKDTLIPATQAAQVLGGGFPLVAGLAVGGLAVLASRPDRRAVAGALFAWLAACALTVVWQGNYIQYHYTLMHAPLALLAAAVLADGVSRAVRAAGGVVLAGAIGLLAWRMTPLMQDAWLNVVVQRKTLAQMHLESRQAAYYPAADYLREKTGPGDSISVFGDAPWLYTLAERPNATRFAFVNVWIKKRASVGYARFLYQWAQDLARNQPVYVVLPKENFPWPDNNTLDDYKQAGPVFDYVEAHYRYEGEVGPFLMFKRTGT